MRVCYRCRLPSGTGAGHATRARFFLRGSPRVAEAHSGTSAVTVCRDRLRFRVYVRLTRADKDGGLFAYWALRSRCKSMFGCRRRRRMPEPNEAIIRRLPRVGKRGRVDVIEAFRKILCIRVGDGRAELQRIGASCPISPT
jgi:hypothetical protein